jgi:hypothetical protein
LVTRQISNDVIVHGNAERLCDRDELLRYLDICLRRRRIARRTAIDRTRMGA